MMNLRLLNLKLLRDLKQLRDLNPVRIRGWNYHLNHQSRDKNNSRGLRLLQLPLDGLDMLLVGVPRLPHKADQRAEHQLLLRHVDCGRCILCASSFSNVARGTVRAGSGV